MTTEPTIPVRTPGGNNGMIIGMLVVGLLVLGSGLAGAGFLAWQYFTQRPDTIPRLLAADTHVFAAVTPSLADLPQILRLRQAFPDDADPGAADEPLTNQLAEELGVNFEQDIAPWLGSEIAWAINNVNFDDLPNLDSIDRPDVDLQSEMILIFTSRDNNQAQAFLDKQRQHREGQGQQFAMSEVDGVRIYARQGGAAEALDAFALVRDYVIFAGSADTISAIVQRDPNGDATLEANANFQKVRDTLPAERLGYMVIANAPLLAAFDEGSADLPPTLARQRTDQRPIVAAMHGMGFAISAHADGLAFDAIASMERGRLSENSLALLTPFEYPIQAERVGRISADALAFSSFTIPPSFKDTVLQGIRDQPGGEQQLEEFEREMGFNLEDDLLSWFYGESHLALVPGSGAAAGVPLAGYFALKPEQLTLAENGMRNILQSLEIVGGLAGGFSFEDREAGGATWRAVEVMPEFYVGQTFSSEEFMLAVGEEAMGAAANPSQPISQNGSYQAATRQIPNPIGAMFYVNMPQTVDKFIEFDMADAEIRERLQPIRAIAASASPGFNEAGVARAQVFVVIAAE